MAIIDNEMQEVIKKLKSTLVPEKFLKVSMPKTLVFVCNEKSKAMRDAVMFRDLLGGELGGNYKRERGKQGIGEDKLVTIEGKKDKPSRLTLDHTNKLYGEIPPKRMRKFKEGLLITGGHYNVSIGRGSKQRKAAFYFVGSKKSVERSMKRLGRGFE
ncbi:MAG: hypothetical protein AAF138_01385 [Planctomycetota bacterium]